MPLHELEADLRRRDFITLVGGASTTWPTLGHVQRRSGKVWRIGFVAGGQSGGLCMKGLSLLEREWRYSFATRSIGFARKCFGHVAFSSCQPSLAPGWQTAKVMLRSPRAKPFEGTGNGRCCVRLAQLGRSRVRHPYGAGAVRLNHLRRDRSSLWPRVLPAPDHDGAHYFRDGSWG
jgi:hypothetical protein